MTGRVACEDDYVLIPETDGSGGAAGDAPSTAAGVDFPARGERALAGLATAVADDRVVRTAGLGRRLFSVTRAAIPDTFAEGHRRSLQWEMATAGVQGECRAHRVGRAPH